VAMRDWLQVCLRLSIACLTLTSGAIAVDAAPRSKQAIAKTAPVATQNRDSAVNQAKYLRLDPQVNSQKSIFLVQDTSDSNLRQNLKIDPLPTVAPPTTNAPSLGFGIPSAFGASWGDAFISAAIATAGKSRDGQVDGSISTGFGVGDARNAVGLEVVYNMGSIRNFGSNGTFDAKLHRVIYNEGATQIAVAAGWDAFAQYGNEGVRPSSAYGAVSSYTLLQPDDSLNKMPISFTLGVGGGNFRKGNASTGVFGGVGLQVHPQIGVGAAWSGVGLNFGVSYVPEPSIPLTISISGLDLTDNSVGGRVLLFGVSYGFNFLPTK